METSFFLVFNPSVSYAFVYLLVQRENPSKTFGFNVSELVSKSYDDTSSSSSLLSWKSLKFAQFFIENLTSLQNSFKKNLLIEKNGKITKWGSSQKWHLKTITFKRAIPPHTSLVKGWFSLNCILAKSSF